MSKNIKNVSFTQAQLNDAIMILAKHINQEEKFAYFIKNSTVTKFITLLTYQLFVHEFAYDTPDDILYSAYRTVLAYTKALNNDGYVIFTEPTKKEVFEQDELLNLQLDEKIIQVKFHRYGESSNSLVFIGNMLTIVENSSLSKTK